MPVMNGMEALREIKKINSATKVIIVTAVEDEEIIAEAKNYGIVEYITKPLILEQLERTVAGVASELKTR